MPRRGSMPDPTQMKSETRHERESEDEFEVFPHASGAIRNC